MTGVCDCLMVGWSRCRSSTVVVFVCCVVPRCVVPWVLGTPGAAYGRRTTNSTSLRSRCPFYSTYCRNYQYHAVEAGEVSSLVPSSFL